MQGNCAELLRYRYRETALEKVRQYYRDIDDNKLDEVIAIFAESSTYQCCQEDAIPSKLFIVETDAE